MTASRSVGRGSNPASWLNSPKGADHHRWNDGRIVNSDGYVKVRVGLGHPLADPNGYAYEHLLVWVSAGNARPPRGWLLHHVDEDRANNRIGNLEFLTRAEHNRRHNAERQRDARGRLLPKAANNNGYPEAA